MSDGGGLHLWVLPGGAKTWRYAYCFNGRQKDVVLRQYPAVSLSEARERRNEAKRLLANGIDPGQQKKLDKIAKALSDAATFEAVAEEYLAKKQREGMAESMLIGPQTGGLRAHLFADVEKVGKPEALLAPVFPRACIPGMACARLTAPARCVRDDALSQVRWHMAEHVKVFGSSFRLHLANPEAGAFETMLPSELAIAVQNPLEIVEPPFEGHRLAVTRVKGDQHIQTKTQGG